MDRQLNEKDVIDAIENAFAMSTNNVEKNTAVYGLLNGFSGICKAMIKRLPSAEPQERKGKWIMTWNKWFKADLPVCSSCSVGSPYKTKFCPNCGARMEVDNENNH